MMWVIGIVECATKNKKHSHNGILEPYDGKPIPFSITSGENAKLNSGEPVVFKDFKKFGGRGVVIQDIEAPPSICMDMISDIASYPKRVPRVKKVEVYEQKKFGNGTEKTAAKFDVSVVGVRFGYFLKLTKEPKYDTFTWTLDYRYASDFDDNVGHWQIMKHPAKKGWSRVLYSTKANLGAWIPKFVVNHVIKSALTESTTWVKKESETAAKSQLLLNKKSNLGPKIEFPNFFENKKFDFSFPSDWNLKRNKLESNWKKFRQSSVSKWQSLFK